MLAKIISWSLDHRLAVLGGTFALIVSGVLAFRDLPVDAFPDTTPTQVQINTIAGALTPEEVERQLTVVVEQAVAGLPSVEEMRSISKFGLSQVTVRFEEGTDLWFARQVVAERLGNIRLPEGVDPPMLGPVATGLGEVFHYLVRGKGMTLEEVRTIHDWVIARQLRSVPGVAEVNAWGGNEKQWHVIVDPVRLQKFDLTLGDLYEALESNNANVGGGIIAKAGSSSLVLGVGLLSNGKEIGDVVIAARDGVPVYVRDVAKVEVGHEIRRAAVTADGEGEAVLGLGFMLIGENSHTVTAALADRLEEIKKSLPPGIEVTPVYERTELVDRVLNTVKTNLFEAALLVIAILFLFLGNIRAGLAIAAAIPLSMLFAFNGMLRFGIAGTLMSLGAIDFGMVVDGSIILMENAERKLAEDRGRRSIVDVVREASIEVVRPVLFGGLIITVVYLPILALEGVEGQMFRPMALTVVFALLGATILSITLMPVLATFVLKSSKHHHHIEPLVVRVLKGLYAPVVQRVLARPKPVVVAALAVLAFTGAAATRLGSEFVPRLSEGAIVVNTIRLAEVALDESVRYGTQIEKRLLEKFPDEIERVWTRTGTPEVATDAMGVELSDVFVTLKPRDEWTRASTQEELVSEMEEELAGMPGMRMSFLQPIEMRVNEMIAGVRGDLAIKLFGDDLDILKAKAREIEDIVGTIEGAEDVTTEQVTGQPVTRIVVNQEAIARYGIPAKQVLDVIAAMGTRDVGEIREGERRFELAVRLDDRYRTNQDALESVRIAAADGTRVPLGRLVTIEEVSGPTTIQREWAKRRIVVQANVRDRDLGSFVEEAKVALEQVELPSGYYVRYGGQFENLERARGRLLLVVPLSLLLIFVLLYASYGSVIDALRVFAAVPFALVGGIFALLLRDLPFSISAAVGFIALSGVAVLDNMVMVSRIRQLTADGMEILEALRDAAMSRMRPVLMTASVASIGFLPMAISTGPGAEVQRPLATVVIGGMMTATLLTLVVLPAVYAWTSRGRATQRLQARFATRGGSK